MFSNIEVTGRELFFSVIGGILLVSLGFFIATTIHNAITEANEPYLRALKVDKNQDLFDHALKTNVGYTLAEGYLETPQPVTNPNIPGSYLSILEIEEHYVQKTRVVTTTVNGKTQTRTETYWVWEEVNRVQQDAPSFTFLGKEFSTDQINLNTHQTHSMVDGGFLSSKRFIYLTIPSSFNTSLFLKTGDKVVTDLTYYPDKTISQVVTQKEGEADGFVGIFWFVWLISIVLVAVFFVSLENEYLNNLGKPTPTKTRFRGRW